MTLGEPLTAEHTVHGVRTLLQGIWYLGPFSMSCYLHSSELMRSDPILRSGEAGIKMSASELAYGADLSGVGGGRSACLWRK